MNDSMDGLDKQTNYLLDRYLFLFGLFLLLLFLFIDDSMFVIILASLAIT